jgi:serine protease Do
MVSQNSFLKRTMLSNILALSLVMPLNGVLAQPNKPSAPAIELEKTFVSVIKTVKPSVVDISAKKTVTRNVQPNFPFDDDMMNDPMFKQFFRRFMPQQPQREELQTRGSGVIVRSDGYILTNNHVVANVDKITVTLSDGRTKEAKVIGTDDNSDLAVIKIEGDKYPAAELGDSDLLDVGDIVFAFGSPFSFSGSVSQGIVSGLSRELGLNQYENLIQTDAAMNPGNSGGPLVNMQGQVIGINKAIATQGVAQSAGLGFAIPINLARKVMGDIIESGKWVRGYLGIYMDELSEEKAKEFNIPGNKGILVSKVIEKSPAEIGGLKEYDVIISFNGKPVESARELQSMVAMTKIGTKIPVTIIRDGKTMTLQITITERTEEAEIVGKDTMKKWGMTLQTLTEALAKEKNIEFGNGGLLVTDIDQDSDAFRLGIYKGDVILEIDKKPVTSIQSFSDIVKDKKEKDKVLIRARMANGGYKIVLFTIPESKAK